MSPGDPEPETTVQPPGGTSSPGSDAEDRSEAEVLYALQHRPRLSIRARLLFGFLLLVLLSLGEDFVNLVTLRSLGKKLDFLLVSERYLVEIQQARRYEKNYFLYGTGLEEALLHAVTADSLLTGQASPLALVAGTERIHQLQHHTRQYAALLKELPTGQKALPADRARIEPLLREHGSWMVNSAFDLSRRERESVERMLELSEWAPWVFVALLLILSLFMSVFLGKPIIRRLGQLMTDTERIAKGDFTPITPVRRYRDEISNLTIALNRMMHDLRRHEEAMVQSHKLRAVGTLTAGIAHELNNPLNNIVLTASVLEDDYSTLSETERLEMVHDLTLEADRAKTIVRNLLDFARESGRGVEQFDLGEMLRETLKLLRNQIKIHKVHSSLDVPGHALLMHGDRQQISQVFVNLVINALDVLPEHGHIDITVKKDSTRGYVAVNVRDDGPGIPSHILPNIFDPFFTTKPTGKGAGLGLSVSLGIVKRHGGNITVESTPGKGTVFRVVLPVAGTPAVFKPSGSADPAAS